jgi:2,4-dienoyl-CoA reductase-like NADH-dependent reductase (Old Yellow Enzyme family)/thioredoxin reductase
MEMKNRLIMAPCERNYAHVDGTPSVRYIDYLVERAKGGVALMIIEATYIDPVGKNHIAQLGFYDESQIESHKKLTDAVHAAGGKVAVELVHGGRQCSSDYTGFQPVGPSAVPCATLSHGDIPRPLTIAEIKELVQKYAKSAALSQAAGYDAVELHGCHGYLLYQFISPRANKRTDEYGGSLENRMRFPLEVVKAVRETLGGDYPLIYRHSGEEKMPDGSDLAETCIFCQELEKSGVDLIDISAGTYESVMWIVQPTSFPHGVMREVTREIKKHVSIPVATVGRINTPDFAEELLAVGDADYISLGRALHADPFFPLKAQTGRADEIQRCPACMACSDQLGTQLPISCSINPRAGRERELAVIPAAVKKNVLVIGGGPGGLTAAMVAAQRGHKVKLVEKENRAGGQILYATVPAHKNEFGIVAEDMESLAVKAGVQIIKGQNADSAYVLTENPDAVLVATGSNPVIPATICGLERIPHCVATDILSGKIVPAKGEHILLMGAGLVGCETAIYLSDNGYKVTVVEPGAAPVRGLGLREGWVLRACLEESPNINIKTSTTVDHIDEQGVTLQSRGVYTAQPFDRVVFAIGLKVNDRLYEELILSGYQGEIYPLGDAVLPRKVKDATYDAYQVAMKI